MCWENASSEIKNEEELLLCRPTLYSELFNEVPAETEEACAAVGRRTSRGTVGRKNKRCGSSFGSSGRQSEQDQVSHRQRPDGVSRAGGVGLFYSQEKVGE